MTIVGKHVLTGQVVEMTRRLKDGMLLFTVTDYKRNPPNDIVLEIDPRKLKGAFGPNGIAVRAEKEIVFTHRDCGCPLNGKDGTILPCTCPRPHAFVTHAFISMHARMPYLSNERCLTCAEPRAGHSDGGKGAAT